MAGFVYFYAGSTFGGPAYLPERTRRTEDEFGHATGVRREENDTGRATLTRETEEPPA